MVHQHGNGRATATIVAGGRRDLGDSWWWSVRSSALRKWVRACSSSACCAKFIRCCRRGLPLPPSNRRGGLRHCRGAPAATLFGVLHGAGNGILTIAKGTLPLVIFGPHGYGHRQGLLMVPARIAQALAPWLFGICIDLWGAQALWLSGGLGLGRHRGAVRHSRSFCDGRARGKPGLGASSHGDQGPGPTNVSGRTTGASA